MVDMSSIRATVVNSHRVVILKENHGDRYLPIWIGPAEADAIAMKLQDVTVFRPLTHDLFCSLVAAMGAKIKFIVINDLLNGTLYAKIHLSVHGRDLEVDSRPSDAIAIAVRARIPIYAEEELLQKASIVFDQETGKPIPSSQAHQAGGKGRTAPVTDEELRKLSAFTNFINTLEGLRDLDKDKD